MKNPTQEIRLLLVVSNFGHLRNVLIPSMISELEGAFGINIEGDKQVCRVLLLRQIRMESLKRSGPVKSFCLDTHDGGARIGQDAVRELH